MSSKFTVDSVFKKTRAEIVSKAMPPYKAVTLSLSKLSSFSLAF